jgi:tetratricopeptide (TPR) repeat protein
LQRFLDGQPIRARSIGQIERAWRWCRRNSRVAFLSTTVLLLLTTLAVVSPLVAIHQAGLRRDRETAIAQARDAALQALLSSSTDDVLEVVRSLHRYGAQVEPLLKQKLADPTLTDKQQLHVRLARLLGAPEHVDDLRDRMLGGQTSPQELDVICRALREFAQPAAMAPALRSLSKTVVDPNVDNHSRFRAACAAASIDPNAVQWETAADDIVGYLVMQPPIDIPDWLKLLRPVAHTLRGPLEDVFHHPQSNAERVIATMALAMFLEDDAEPIIELIKLADAPELVELVRELRPHGERAVMRLLEELKSDRMPSVVLNHPRAWDCPETVLEQFKASRGMITPRYAICQSLALAELEPLAERLREGGYRPIKCRPYRDGHQLLVAAVWIRDPTSWRLKVGLTAEEVQTLTSRWSAEGMRPADVAGYDPEPGLWRCVAIWVTDDLASHEVHLALLLRDAEWQASSDKLMAQRYVPVTTQIAQGQDEEVRRCQIWYKPGPRPFRELRSRLSSARSLSVTGKLPVDISVYANLAGQPRYGAVWHRDQTVDSYVATELAPDELLQKCRELERREYLPAGISVVRLASVPSPVTACVWHRPVQTAEAKRRLARAKANIAIALLQLGETASVLPYLKPSSDPQFTTDLVHGVPLARVNPETILEPLEHTELQSDTRQTLLLMLAGYGTRSLSEPRQRAIRQQLLELYHTDPDPGIHSAAQRLLRHWLGDEPTAEAMPTTDADDRRWHVTPHGLTMAHIELDATSSANAWCEGRVIAVDTKETTLALFRQFRPAHQLDETPGVDPNHPVTNVSWYDAVGFCQFLNEQEGIPESEWCYLPNDDGEFAEGMRIAPGFFLKTGYRLLTAQEWKQSAAAGQDFFFGHDSGLLQYYGWSAENSPKGPSEVGRLLPNFHGLFDVHGNVMEWCHDSAPTGELRRVLGGHFGQLSRQIQAHLAVELPAAERNGHTGLRVARTLRGATTEVFAKAERFAQRGDWEAACREIEQALKQRPNEWFYRCQLARLKLYLGDMDEYRQECHCLLQQLRDPEASKHFTPIVPFATITHEIGIALIGSPNTLEDWTPLIEQATKYADVSSGNKRTLAMVHFRNGDFATSSQLLAEVRPKQQSFGLAKTMFFQAMAYQKLGQETEARRCFDDGVKKFAELKAELREGYFGPRWRGWIYCTLLEHEARQALGLAL